MQLQMDHQPCAQTRVDNYPLGYFSSFTAFAQLKSKSFARSQNLDFDVENNNKETDKISGFTKKKIYRVTELNLPAQGSRMLSMLVSKQTETAILPHFFYIFHDDGKR